MGILMGDGSLPGLFHMPIFGSSLNVGALVEPLTSQMADYLGVPSGLMVKQVARKSEAAAAGLRAFDVILKVGTDSITNLSGWDRALRANQGKPVQVTILRDKKQQTLTLQVDSKHKSALEDLFPEGECPQVAEMDPEFASDALAASEAMGQQAQMIVPKISQEEVEALRKQAEALRESIQANEFKIDAKQMEQLKQQMDEWRKSFKAEELKIDPKQMEELKKQMEEWRKNFNPEALQLSPGMRLEIAPPATPFD
jgi:membrane-associated protease RseP (regulator of RpoE activity)